SPPVLPVKKGRGRPRKKISKPEDESQLNLVPTVKKGRGRPRKKISEAEDATSPAPPIMRKRGRPAKKSAEEGPKFVIEEKDTMASTKPSSPSHAAEKEPLSQASGSLATETISSASTTLPATRVLQQGADGLTSKPELPGTRRTHAASEQSGQTQVSYNGAYGHGLTGVGNQKSVRFTEGAGEEGSKISDK
ncbi:MAG: hypothetical protein Q9180_005758, partial [Flavoplaca navasiana]